MSSSSPNRDRRPAAGRNLRAGRSAVIGLLGLACLCAVALVAPAAAGVRWSDAGFDEALALAKKQNTLLMIDVYSEQCHSCKDIEAEIWQTSDGEALVKDLVALQIDSSSPAGADLSRRVPVLGLPVVIFLDENGQEIGRIQGYTMGKGQFMREALDLKSGIDPLPAMEAALAAQPDSQPLLYDVMEQYLFRKRQHDAQTLLDRIMALDPEHTSELATRGMTTMAKFHEYYRRDFETSLSLWKSLVELYPTSSGVTSGIRGSCEIAMSWKQLDQWYDWICKIGAEHPDDGRLHYNIAIIPYHKGLRHPCLAKSARIALAKGVGPKNMDEIAAKLEGGAEE